MRAVWSSPQGRGGETGSFPTSLDCSNLKAVPGKADPDGGPGKIELGRGLYARHLEFTVPRLRGGVQGRGQRKPCPSPKQNRKGLRGPVWQQRNMAVQRERGRKGEWHRAPGSPMEEVLRH